MYRLYYALRGYPRHSMRNVVRAMHSLKRVTELWMTTAAAHVPHRRGKKGALRAAAVASGWYSHIIYARPDLRYMTPLNVTLLRGLNDDELYTPSWACWQGGFLCLQKSSHLHLRWRGGATHWFLTQAGTTTGSPRAGPPPPWRSGCA